MKKNIIVLYDERSTFTNTVKEHLYSFKDFSRHNIFYAPATNLYWPNGAGFTEEVGKDIPRNRKWDFNAFDVIVLHYSARVSLSDYLAPQVTAAIRKFTGRKVLFLQDEYENVNTSRANIDQLGFDTIFTCVPQSALDYVYEASSKRSHIEFKQTLTGYVPYLQDLTQFTTPMAERPLTLAYRGRKLPHHYGLLGYEKFIIGERFREEAARRGMSADVEVDEGKRIYGSWYEFLGSSRATLGTESGCNIFDFDGSLKAKAETLAQRPFLEVYPEFFAPYETAPVMNQISPKFFEAIMLRTALVCFPGTYSGILRKDDHFIQIEKDFSNIDEVLEKLEDIPFLEELTKRAFEDIIAPGVFSYRSFVRDFDEWVDERVSKAKLEIVTTPIGSMLQGVYTPFGHNTSTDLLMNNAVLSDGLGRETFCSLHERQVEEPTTWNCARINNGARVSKSSPFFEHPHDASSLLRPPVRGNYAAGIEGSDRHFIEFDLGTRRILEQIKIHWLDGTNLAEDFFIKVSTNGIIWKTVFSTDRNSDAEVSILLNHVIVRYLRLEARKFRGQNRILLRRFEVLARYQ